MAPQLGGGRRHNYSTKSRQAGRANEQSMYSLMSIVETLPFLPELNGHHLLSLVFLALEHRVPMERSLKEELLFVLKAEPGANHKKTFYGRNLEFS